jgi:hypothetical protein
MAPKKRKKLRPRSKPSFASRHPQPLTADALVYTEYDIIDEPLDKVVYPAAADNPIGAKTG